MPTTEDLIRDHLSFLYGERGPEVWAKLSERLAAFAREHPALAADRRPPAERLSERDAVLITYGDQVSEPGVAPLAHAGRVHRGALAGAGQHRAHPALFPYSSDDGFSIIDFEQVNPAWGAWSDVAAVGSSFRLMFDLVLNHMSRQSEWFRRYCAGDPAYAGYFISVPPGTDLSQVTRPRTLPLLTEVETTDGPKLIWTTFSDDQMDLNFADPTLMLRMVDVLLFYAAQGAEIIRLDAVAFLWKIIGTTCLHLEQTHRVVKLFRAILDLAAPGVLIITETNVPHAENISYFWQRQRRGAARLPVPLAAADLPCHRRGQRQPPHPLGARVGRSRPDKRRSTISWRHTMASACARWRASCRPPRCSG